MQLKLELSQEQYKRIEQDIGVKSLKCTTYIKNYLMRQLLSLQKKTRASRLASPSFLIIHILRSK